VPKTTVSDVIKEAIANDQPQHPTTSMEATAPSITPELQGKLQEARENMRKATKAYVMGGIPDALDDIARGDFGDILPELNQAVEIFAKRVTAPKLPTLSHSSPSSLFLPDAHHG
jgi:hypothetical protein